MFNLLPPLIYHLFFKNYTSLIGLIPFGCEVQSWTQISRSQSIGISQPVPTLGFSQRCGLLNCVSPNGTKGLLPLLATILKGGLNFVRSIELINEDYFPYKIFALFTKTWLYFEPYFDPRGIFRRDRIITELAQ